MFSKFTAYIISFAVGSQDQDSLNSPHEEEFTAEPVAEPVAELIVEPEPVAADPFTIVDMTPRFGNYRVKKQAYLSQLSTYPSLILLLKTCDLIDVRRSTVPYYGKGVFDFYPKDFTKRIRELTDVFGEGLVISVKDEENYAATIRNNLNMEIKTNFLGDGNSEVSLMEVLFTIDSHQMSCVYPMTHEFLRAFNDLVMSECPDGTLPRYFKGDKHPVTIGDLCDRRAIRSIFSRYDDNATMMIRKKLVTFFNDVMDNPEKYGGTHDSVRKLLGAIDLREYEKGDAKYMFTRTLYELGCMVHHYAKGLILASGETIQIHNRKANSGGFVNQVDLCGIRRIVDHIEINLERKMARKQNANIPCEDLFSEIVIEYREMMAKSFEVMFREVIRQAQGQGQYQGGKTAYVLVSAIGMGVWGRMDTKQMVDALPEIYWGGMLDALTNIGDEYLGKLLVFVNPCGKTNNEMWELLTYSPYVYPVEKCLVSLAKNLVDNLDSSKNEIFIVNASDPDRTLGCMLTGECCNKDYAFVNACSMSGGVCDKNHEGFEECNVFDPRYHHPTTTEEHYFKIISSAIFTTEQITGALHDETRQRVFVYGKYGTLSVNTGGSDKPEEEVI